MKKGFYIVINGEAHFFITNKANKTKKLIAAVDDAIGVLINRGTFTKMYIRDHLVASTLSEVSSKFDPLHLVTYDID